MQVVCDVNIDMIGRNAPDKLNITPTKDHAEYSWLTKVAEEALRGRRLPQAGQRG
ncbi:MAG: hypothetical protein R3E96_01545 [Planctomycetota bacterium]